MPCNENNEFESIVIREQGAAQIPPGEGRQRLYVDSADHALKLVDRSGTISEVGGSSGSSILHQETVTLNNAQTLAMDTPVQVVAAPGSDYILLPQFWFARLGPCATNYTGGTQLQVTVGTGAINPSVDADLFFGYGDPSDAVTAFCGNAAIAPALGGSVRGLAGTYDSDIRNKAIFVNTLTALADGAPGNSLTVTVSYFKFNVVTGVFV